MKIQTVLIIVAVSFSFFLGGCATKVSYLTDQQMRQMSEEDFGKYLAQEEQAAERMEKENKTKERQKRALGQRKPLTRAPLGVWVPGLKVSVMGGAYVYPNKRTWRKVERRKKITVRDECLADYHSYPGGACGWILRDF